MAASDGTPAGRGRGAGPQAKGERTRRAILDAAIQRFGRDGYRGTSVADIARDAGVSGTLTYAYFPNKEALFLAALDEDAATVIDQAIHMVFHQRADPMWRRNLVVTLVDAVDRQPLARRVMAGLEPHATERMLEIPALTELRKAIAERLRADQLTGTVRPDIDPVRMANGAVTIFLSLLMSVLQFGREGVERYGDDVAAVFEAAFDRAPPPG